MTYLYNRTNGEIRLMPEKIKGGFSSFCSQTNVQEVAKTMNFLDNKHHM